MGVAYIRKGMYAKVIGIFRKGIVVDPDDPGMHYFLGIVFMNAGELDNAIKEFKYTLVLSPDHEGAFYSLGMLITIKTCWMPRLHRTEIPLR